MTEETQNEVVETETQVSPQSEEVVSSEEQVTEAKVVSQEDFNKLYFQLKQLERENKVLSDTKPTHVDTPVDKVEEPTLEQFDYDENEYLNAKIQHQVSEQVELALASQASTVEKNEALRIQQEVTTSFNDKAVAYAATNPDYETAIMASNGMTFAPHIQEVLLSSEKGPQLDHMLLSDPMLAQKLNQMTPTQAIMEMGRMEHTISTPVAATKLVSSAPEPIETTGGAGHVSGDYRYDENVGMADYYAQHQANLKK